MIQDLAKEGGSGEPGRSRVGIRNIRLHPIPSLSVLLQLQVWCLSTVRRLWSKIVSDVVHFRRMRKEGVYRFSIHVLHLPNLQYQPPHEILCD